MKKEDFFEVLGELDDGLVNDATSTEKNNKAARLRLVKWGVAAACLCLAAAAAFFYKSGDSPKTLSRRLEERGLFAETIEDPIFTVSGEERPELRKEDLLRILQAGTVVKGKVQRSSYVEVTAENEHWYIVQITLEVSDVISGVVSGDSVELVSACEYIGDEEETRGQFLIEGSLLECRDGTEGVFVLREIERDVVWNIGGIDVAARSHGDHMVTMRLGVENDQYTYNGITITGDEIHKRPAYTH